MIIYFAQVLFHILSQISSTQQQLVSFPKNVTRISILSVELLGKGMSDCYGISKEKVFPEHSLIETAPDILQLDLSNNTGMFRRRHVRSAASANAANLTASVHFSKEYKYLPPVVAR